MSKPKRRGIIKWVILALVVVAGAGFAFLTMRGGGNWRDMLKWKSANTSTAPDCGDECGYDGDPGDEPGYTDVEPDADGYITDPRDARRYRTVKIGDLRWTAENLNYEADGSRCYGNNDNNCAKYGRLYGRWSGLNQACPPGWRLPSVAEWDNLFIAAGGSYDDDNRRWNVAGTKLKAKAGWKNRGGGTDDFGFAALPGGLHDGHNYAEPSFDFAEAGGYWWARGKSDDDYQQPYRAMGWDMTHVNENVLPPLYSFSVRCVMGHAGPPAAGKGRPVPAAPEINPAVAAGTPETRWYRRGAKNITISTADQLAGLAELVRNGNSFEGATVSLSADIDLAAYGKGSAFNGGKGWMPIGGNCEASFRGRFDGNGQKIRGLYINDRELVYAGLFGCVGGEGVIMNLGVVGVDVTGNSLVGGLAGNQNGATLGSYSSGTVNGIDLVGGLTGWARTLSNCHSAATVNGDQNVGGLTGNVNSLTTSYSTGTVRGTTNVGGLVGSTDGNLRSCYSSATVSGRAGRVGGIVGFLQNGGVVNCYATGTVSGREATGGVAGSVIFGGRVENSVALNPSVKGAANAAGRVAGFVLHGHLSNNAAFAGLLDADGKTRNWTVKGHDDLDGAEITAEEISADGTVGNRFTEPENDEYGSEWTMEPGKLPGLGDKAVEMPEHLR